MARARPLDDTVAAPAIRTRRDSRAPSIVLGALALGNGAVVLWLWLHGGGITLAGTLDGQLTSLGRITALVGTYLILIQLVLLARLPWLERRIGFDRLTVWHRRNGKVAIVLVLGHVPLTIAGYALTDRLSFADELDSMFSSLQGMVTASVGTVILMLVVGSSLGPLRRRMPYELWHGFHLTVYAGILLAWFHETPDGNEFSASPAQRVYWYALSIGAVAVVALFRVAAPIALSARHRLRVTDVRRESADVVSVYVSGRALDRLGARGGQFLLWRFLTSGRWWQAHPFSLSASPDEHELRITVKGVGSFSDALGSVRPGCHVIAEGPFGRFTADLADPGSGVVLIAGGIGITPLRAMLDQLLRPGRPVDLIRRVARREDLVLDGEIVALAALGDLRVHDVVGPHAPGDGILDAEHLIRLVPDIAQRDVFLCGPPGMMHSVRASLQELGLRSDQIHSERFALAADQPPHRHRRRRSA